MVPFAPDLTFLAPERFALLLVPLLLALLYLVRQRRRLAYVVRFTDPELIDSVAPRRPGLRRHLVAAVYLLATANGVPMGFPMPWIVGVSILLLIISGASGLLALGILKKSQPADLLR